MDIQIFVLAAAAIFIFVWLFSVMGKQEGAPPPAFKKDAEPEARRGIHVVPEPGADEGEEVGGLEAITRADPTFSPREFIKGARSAYEMIVKAFADADYKTLASLLDEDVYRDYERAIKAREADGSAPVELMRIKEASIEGGAMKGSVAEVSVLFVAELSDGERVNRTRELWTFERDTKNRDPNWRLSDVSVG